MIIALSDAFDNVDFSIDAVSRAAVDTICQSVARGEHFLLASRRLAIKLSNEAALSHTTRGVMEWLRSEYTYIKGLLNGFRYRVEVCPAAARFERQPNLQEWVVPAKHVADFGIRPTILLAENSHDGDVYCFAAKHYMIEAKLQGVQLRIEPRNGNGAGISQELSRIAKEKIEFCLCITDSDRLAPTCEPGEIARACARVTKGSHSVIDHTFAGARELENAIPHTLFKQVAEDSHPDTWDEFQERLSVVPDEAVRFADLKNGVLLCSIFKFAKTSPQRTYWLKVATEVFPGSDCLEQERCDNAEDCKCSVLPGFGENIARGVRERLGGCSSHESYRTAKASANIDDWMMLGQAVLEAGAAPPRMRL
ncbi:hypothetical protein [Trinickia soli]|uniref:Uncharacterized protein n=1 Tax=Trinickia soli TaxID=380675 RepID=A0A2N7VW62_9BURK|nr:hypothetical protein [Trinickia soli]PMS21382.1 hypothetical protein C0Z19_18290 [Trinickia soli]CAB3699949.1 hypothetical protein LMG24076_03374 [Trinickia soli]